MINKTTLGFILILVAAFLSVVEGDGSQKINCEVPGQVEGLLLTPRSQKIVVNWNKTNINDCVTLYFISWRNLATGSFYNSIVSREVNFYVIEDLNAGVEYEVTVIAVNDRGQSPAVTGYKRTESDGPGNIASLTAVPQSHSITVSWINTNENENCSVSYAIAWKDVTNDDTNGNDVTENKLYFIDSLEACVKFEVSVTALSKICGDSEDAITTVTTLPDVPGQVQDFSLKPCSHNISVTWNDPIINSYCVKQYLIFWRSLKTRNFFSSIVPTEVNVYTIQGLAAGVEYEVSVIAVNELYQNSTAVTGKTTTTVSDGTCKNTSPSHIVSVNWKKPTIIAVVLQIVLYSVCTL